MGLIGKIRKNNWLLIVLIGLGLAAFIMMDSMSGDKSIGAATGNTLANIAGNKVSISEWERMYATWSNSFKSSDSYAQRNGLWEYLVQKSIMKEEASATGLGVSKDELINLQFGPMNTLSPLMASRFPTQSANQFAPPTPNMQLIQQYQQMLQTGENLTKDISDFWILHEAEVRTTRLQTKLNNLVSKSMYTPSWMVEKAYIDQTQTASFEYVKIPFGEIDNSEVTVEDADLQAYLDANVAEFMLDEESRRIGYVTFDVTASGADSALVKKNVTGLAQKFIDKAQTTNDSSFIENNYGQFDNAWVEADKVNPAIKDAAFTIPVGTATSTYLDGRAYKFAAVMDRRVLPDSAQCRHILVSDEGFIRAQQANPSLKLNSSQYAFFKQRADSILNVLENLGGNFDTLALKHSSDGGSAQKGGFYDWAPVNQFVPSFNDVVFFSGELNKLYIVKSSFGYHIIEPLKRKTITNTERVRLAYVSENIKPSKSTRKEAYNAANSFIKANGSLEKMKAAAAADLSLEYASSNPVTANDYSIANIGANEESRKMVKFVYGGDAGDVSSKVFTFQDQVDFYDNKYIVAAVESVQAEGKPSINHLREDLTFIVRNQKKGAIIAGKINTQDLNVLAQTFSSEVSTAKDVRFNAPTVPGLGQEPMVVATAFNAALNATSQPIIGENGVYVVKTTSKSDVGAPSNIAAIRNTIRMASQNQITTGVRQAMRKNASISDKRAKFF